MGVLSGADLKYRQLLAAAGFVSGTNLDGARLTQLELERGSDPATGGSGSSSGGVVYNVKNYGAKGDGITDDTTTIQAAINAAGKGGIIHFPEGTYLVSATFSSDDGLTYRGEGARQSIIKVAATHSGTNVLSLSADTEIIVTDLGFDGSNHLTCVKAIQTNTSGTVKNLTITRCYFTSFLPKTVSSYGTSSGALWLWSANGIDVLYNEIVDCGRGIIIDDPSSGRVNVIGNRITNPSGTDICSSGIYIKKATGFAPDTRVVVRDNFVSDCQRDPTDVSPFTGNGAEGHGIVVSRCRGIRIINNTCVNNGRGILCSNESMDTLISGNECYYNLDSGIRCEPESSTQDITLGTAGDQRGLIISDNVCRDNGWSGNQHLGYYGKGIEVSYAAGSILVGNICYGNLAAGINIDSGAVTLLGNRCYNNWKGTYVPSPSPKGGIRIQGATPGSGSCMILGNLCFDNQTVKTQEYGLTLGGSEGKHLVQGNNFLDNSLGEIESGSTKIFHSFYGSAAVAKPTVTGSKGANAALTSLLSALATLGLVTDSTT